MLIYIFLLQEYIFFSKKTKKKRDRSSIHSNSEDKMKKTCERVIEDGMGYSVQRLRHRQNLESLSQGKIDPKVYKVP